MLAGFVRFRTVACEATSFTIRKLLITTGMVRSALVNPPGPMVSSPGKPSAGERSHHGRAPPSHRRAPGSAHNQHLSDPLSNSWSLRRRLVDEHPVPSAHILHARAPVYVGSVPAILRATLASSVSHQASAAGR